MALIPEALTARRSERATTAAVTRSRTAANSSQERIRCAGNPARCAGNPNIEFRNPKEAESTKFECSKPDVLWDGQCCPGGHERSPHCFEHFPFSAIRISFGFRYSIFEFPAQQAGFRYSIFGFPASQAGMSAIASLSLHLWPSLNSSGVRRYVHASASPTRLSRLNACLSESRPKQSITGSRGNSISFKSVQHSGTTDDRIARRSELFPDPLGPVMSRICPGLGSSPVRMIGSD